VNVMAVADRPLPLARRPRVPSLLALAVALLTLPGGGCVASEKDAGGAAEEADVSMAPGGLETRVTLRRAAGDAAHSFRAGEPITVIVTLHNRATVPQSLTLPTSQTHDCIIYRGARSCEGGGTPAGGGGDGRPAESARAAVWRYSQGRMFAQMLTELTLAPGESRSFTTTWNQTDARGDPVPPGDYQVVGLVPGGAPGCRAEPVGFTIRPAAAADR